MGLTDNEIQMRIVPALLRWPPADVAKTIAWDRLREAVDALRSLVRVVDDRCLQAEQNQDLSPGGVARRRTELGRQALTELASFKPFQLAEKAVSNDLALLEKGMADLPQPPTEVADVMLAQEIRQYIRGQKSPIDVAMKSISDPRMLGAILGAPSFLSGLSETEIDVVRERARIALHPAQTEMQKQLKKALDDLREGTAATRRTVLERCQMDHQEKRTPQTVTG